LIRGLFGHDHEKPMENLGGQGQAPMSFASRLRIRTPHATSAHMNML